MDTNNKLVRPDIRRFPHEMSFRFMTENGTYYRKYNPGILGIDTLTPEFDAALGDFDIALEQIRKSPETERIVILDDEFDGSFGAMAGFVRAAVKHYDPNVRKAAENIDIVFKHYGNIGKKPYRQELAASHNLLQELQARNNDVATMGLHPWIDAHSRAAQALAEALDARTGENALKPDIKAADARKRLEAAYGKITDRIEAVMNIHGKQHLAGFVEEYNAHATEYKNALAQHLGRVAKKNTKME